MSLLLLFHGVTQPRAIGGPPIDVVGFIYGVKTNMFQKPDFQNIGTIVSLKAVSTRVDDSADVVGEIYNLNKEAEL